jgi:hypothetical protein
VGRHASTWARAARVGLGEGRAEGSALTAILVARDVEPPAPREVCGQRVQVTEVAVRASSRQVTLGAPAPLLIRLTPRKSVLEAARPERVQFIEAPEERTARVQVATEIAGALAERGDPRVGNPVRGWRGEEVARGMSAARPALTGVSS